MEHSELLRFVVGVIERLGLPYFITGSTASTHYGEPRFTNDIDIVVKLPIRQVGDFCRAFPPNDFYVSEDAAREAAHRFSQFNIIDPAGGLKVDIIVCAQTPLNQDRFARACCVQLDDCTEAMFSSPEDVIIKKLEFYKDGESEKHLRDIAGIVKVSGDRLDQAYIRLWVERLGLENLWRNVLIRCGSGA